ncbi:MAG: hypothetical protein SH857_07760 [Chitinophagales bacterium]|nr:hypothetical protein [Chitinophagales bacterium]
MSYFPLFKPIFIFFVIGFFLFSVCANAQQVFGVSTWLDNNREENMNNFYALHKYASIGTTILVRNPMNNRTAYVKVIGKLPDNETNYGIVIKLSGAAAFFLNMLDEKVRVGLTVQQKSAEGMAGIPLKSSL